MKWELLKLVEKKILDKIKINIFENLKLILEFLRSWEVLQIQFLLEVLFGEFEKH